MVLRTGRFAAIAPLALFSWASPKPKIRFANF